MPTRDSRDQIYPFSTEDNKAIPLDIIRPLYLMKTALVADTLVELDFPSLEGWKVASFYCPAGCFIQFGGATIVTPLVDSYQYGDTLFVPPGGIVTSTVVEGIAKVLMMGTGTSYLISQNISKWAGLSLARKLSKI